MKSPFGDCSRPRHTRNCQRAHTVFARVPQSHRDAINPACTLSIDSPEPIYGLAVIGISSKANIRRNSDAKAGDRLILTKALGVGVYSAAFKKNALSRAAYDELNRVGTRLGEDPDVHAMTDVTASACLGTHWKLRAVLTGP
jgi:selenophosphate synthase